ncbi:MAG: hypothetical protein FXF54_09640 [Kosmotoga sp.]|nr:MAG: hypothetical protein FXF54_09640 [Kosmotoga sp.]
MAHVPYFPDTGENKIFVEDIDLSQIYYYKFTEESTVLTFTFEMKDGHNLHLLFGVPKIDRLKDFHPVMKILSPDGETLDFFDTSQLSPEEMYEPFGDTYSWLYVDYDRILDKGTYSVTIEAKEPGKAWITFGRKERFTAGQILSLPKLIQDIREFHELKGIATWEKYALGILGAITAGVVLFFLL